MSHRPVAGGSAVILTGIAGPTYTDTGLTGTTQYAYSIVGSNAYTTTAAVSLGTITTLVAISAFTTPVATAGAAGVMSITWTGGTGTGVTYTYTVKRAGAVITTGFTVSGTAPNITFTFTDTAQYSYTFAVTATSGASTLTSSESVAVNSTSPVMTSFTTISNLTTATPVTIFTTTTITDWNNTNSPGSIAVDKNQTRMIIGLYSGLYYSTSSDGGTTWATPVLVSSTTRCGVACMSADGTKGFFSNNYTFWTFSWPSGSPGSSITTSQFSTTNFGFCSITPDGQYAVFAAAGGNIYYAYWNGTSYINPGTTIGSFTIHCGVAISPDYSLVTYENNGNWYSTKLTWSNNVPSVGTTSQAVTAVDTRAMAWLGGGQSSKPSYIIGQKSGGGPYVAAYNSTTNTISIPVVCSNLINGGTTTNLGEANYAFTPGGSQGNILYYMGNGDSTTKLVQKITWTVT